MIAIIEYGMGNVGSILNMLKRIGVRAKITRERADIEAAEKIILPGVGSFDHGMGKLNYYDLIPILEKKVIQDKIPVLGICLGMQLLTKGSSEGTSVGLGWIDGTTEKFNFSPSGEKPLKIPHMGWNQVEPSDHATLFKGFSTELPRFYFVHSYHVVCEDEAQELSRSDYGYSFVSAVKKGNVFGTQFHPEKSHKFGMQLLKNYSAL